MTLHGSIYLWLVMKKSSVSRTQRSTYFRFCIMPWKGEREPTIKLGMRRQIDVVQKFITIHSFGQNWWWASGIRVESSKDSPHCSSATKSNMSMFNDISWGSKDNWKECESSAQLVSLYEKMFNRTMVIPRTWIIAEQMMLTFAESKTPSLPIHESVIQRNAQKQRWWKIINTLLRWWGNDWNCFSHTCFCQSAQYLRNSFRFVWRMWFLPWYNRATCCRRTI